MDQIKPSQGVVRVQKHGRQMSHQPSNHSINKDQNFFKIKETDFPSLSEVCVKNSKSEKGSSACGASSLTYSSKLKALPLESQNGKFENMLHCEPELASASKNIAKNVPVLRKASFNNKLDICNGKYMQKPVQSNSQSFKKQTVVPSNNQSTDSKLNSRFSEVRSGNSQSFNAHTSARTFSVQKCADNNRFPTNAYGGSSASKKCGHSSKEVHNQNDSVPFNFQKSPNSKRFLSSRMTNTGYSSTLKSELSDNKGNDRPNVNAQYKQLSKANRFVGSRVGNDQHMPVNRIHNNTNGNSSNKGKTINISVSQGISNSVKTENSQVKNQALNSQTSLATPSEAKKKKKRKSKLKRQAALQTGKILVLTPEVHSKIVSQSTNTSFYKHQDTLVNINDSEEYPELGSDEPKTMKESRAASASVHVKEENHTHLTALTSHTDKENVLVFKDSSSNDNLKAATKSDESSNVAIEKSEGEKSTVHSNNPITLSLFDMLVSAKPKKKEPEKKDDSTNENSSSAKVYKKEIIKKSASLAVNSLASSRPTIKRGKEREKPKVRRPSRMRKLITMEKQLKKENLLMTGSEAEDDNLEKSEGNLHEIQLSYEINEFSNQDNLETHVENLLNCVTNLNNATKTDGIYNLTNEFSELLTFDCEDYDLQSASEDQKDNEQSNLVNETPNDVHQPISSACDSIVDVQNDCVENSTSSLLENSDEVDINTVENIFENCSSIIRNPSEKESHDANFMEDRHKTENTFQTYIDIVPVSGNKVTNMVENVLPGNAVSIINGNIECKPEQKTDAKEVQRPSENLDCSLKNISNVSMSMFSEQERLSATKLMLHSRKFRQYCNHFISKEIDQAVFSLIDDLARFQDRMYQKDPVKAKIRRRLVYGIREIKKHMKLKKVKCIIIATDIEDIKIEGGLNDSLEELISLAASYHIPYVFSHLRFNLGKACRKSVPVSCVGIFNYEGSEKNFKRMIELHGDSRHDYIEVTKILASELTSYQVKELFEAKKESILLLREVSQRILRENVYSTPEGYRNNELSESLEKSTCLQSVDSISLQSQQCEISNLHMNDEKSLCFIEESFNDLKKNENVNNLIQLNDTNVNSILVKYKVVK